MDGFFPTWWNDMPDLQSSSLPDNTAEAFFRHNLHVENLAAAFSGVFLGLVMFASPVVAVVGLGASPLELTILVSAFPVGAFLGPLWAGLGRRWGMQNLVLTMWFVSSVPLLFVYWVESSILFTLLLTFSQLLNGAMRMGQSSLYRVVFPPEKRGQALGRITFWTFVTMVPSVLLTGWLLDKSHEMYQVIYPFGGICGLIGCCYYRLLRIPPADLAGKRQRSFRSGVQNVERVLRSDRLYLLFQVAFFLTGGAFFLSRHVIILLTMERFHFSAFELLWCLSVLPQLLLAVCSPLFGRVLDRIGMIPCRLLISLLLSASLVSHYAGLLLGAVFLMYLGSVFQGLSNAGGQVTWYLAAGHFAPRSEDVSVYNGIHFVLNGVRGLVLPWVGSVLLVLTGTGAVLAATVFSLGSLPVLLRALRLKDDRAGRVMSRRRPEAVPSVPAPALPPASGSGSFPLRGTAS
jgi:MFS family permease